MNEILKDYLVVDKITNYTVANGVFVDLSDGLVDYDYNININLGLALAEFHKAGIPIFIQSLTPCESTDRGKILGKYRNLGMRFDIEYSLLKDHCNRYRLALLIDDDPCDLCYGRLIDPDDKNLLEKMLAIKDLMLKHDFQSEIGNDAPNIDTSEIIDKTFVKSPGKQIGGGNKSRNLWLLEKNLAENPHDIIIPETRIIDSNLYNHIYDNYADAVCGSKFGAEVSYQIERFDNDPKQSSAKIQKLMKAAVNPDEQSPLPHQAETAINNAFDMLAANGKIILRSDSSDEDSEKASCSGIYESYPNTTKENLFQNIYKIHRSLYSVQALMYRKENGWVPENYERVGAPKMNVIMQRQIDPDISGVIFSRSPIKKYSMYAHMSLTIGIADGLLSGTAIGNNYIIDRQSGNIIYSDGNQNINPPINKILSALKYVENIKDREGRLPFEFADFEFGIKDEQLYAFQIRPQTVVQNDYKSGSEYVVGKLRYSFDENEDNWKFSNDLKPGDILITDYIKNWILNSWPKFGGIVYTGKNALSLEHANIILGEYADKNNIPVIFDPNFDKEDMFWDEWAKLDVKTGKITPYIPTQEVTVKRRTR